MQSLHQSVHPVEQPDGSHVRKPFPCEIFTHFILNASLIYDNLIFILSRRSHSTKKAHQCEVCDKGFVNSSSLVLHMRTHTEGDPYACTECEKRFKQPQMLTEHMIIHTEQCLYQCSICREAFKQACELVQHMKGHTGKCDCEDQ